MDIQQLVAALTACANPDANIRKAGEEAVKQVRLMSCKHYSSNQNQF